MHDCAGGQFRSSLVGAAVSSEVAAMWEAICSEAVEPSAKDPSLVRAMNSAVPYHASFTLALAHRIALKLANHDLDQEELLSIVGHAFLNDHSILINAASDLLAVKERDPSNTEILTPFLYFKGFVALQGQRLAHWPWHRERVHLARHIKSRFSEVLSVDIHPAAKMGKGIMLDHGSGLVIGETAVVEDDVSILQKVTLGGTGKESGDRHPKVRRGVLIGAGAKILGDIEIGTGAKVGAVRAVVSAVAPYTSVVGVPARPIAPPRREAELPAVSMNQTMSDPEYVI